MKYVAQTLHLTMRDFQQHNTKYLLPEAVTLRKQGFPHAEQLEHVCCQTSTRPEFSANLLELCMPFERGNEQILHRHHETRDCNDTPSKSVPLQDVPMTIN